jgi:hypothetical protein
MWGKPGIQAIGTEEVTMEASGFYILRDAVQSWCTATGTDGNNPVDLATKLWAMAHGLSALALNGHIKKFMPDVDVDSLIASSTMAFLGGLEKGSGGSD